MEQQPDKPSLEQEDLFPKDQAQKMDSNIECPLCLGLNIPSNDPSIGSTQCAECECLVHFRCALNQRCCPVCKNEEKPVFAKKLNMHRRNELSNLTFECPNKCGEVLKFIDMLQHLENCQKCEKCEAKTNEIIQKDKEILEKDQEIEKLKFELAKTKSLLDSEKSKKSVIPEENKQSDEQIQPKKSQSQDKEKYDKMISTAPAAGDQGAITKWSQLNKPMTLALLSLNGSGQIPAGATYVAEESYDGGKYSGFWKGGLPCGPGRCVDDCNNITEGQFENGERNGYGRYIYDGGHEIGHFKNGSKHGLIMHYNDGSVMKEYSGTYENGRRVKNANGNRVLY